MCQWAMRSRFDRSEKRQIRKVASLSAQALRGNWDHRRVETVSRMGEMDRRKFVKLAGASAAALVFGAGPFTEKAWAQSTFSAYPFSLGVASGDPLPDGVVLWTRLAPNPMIDGGGMPSGSSVQLRWQVA